MTPLWFAITHFFALIEADKKRLAWFERAGNVGLFLGAFTVSFSPAWSVTVFPFLFYTVGNVIWLIVAWRFLRDRPLVEMNLFFLAVNGYGIMVRA